MIKELEEKYGLEREEINCNGGDIKLKYKGRVVSKIHITGSKDLDTPRFRRIAERKIERNIQRVLQEEGRR